MVALLLLSMKDGLSIYSSGDQIYPSPPSPPNTSKSTDSRYWMFVGQQASILNGSPETSILKLHGSSIIPVVYDIKIR